MENARFRLRVNHDLFGGLLLSAISGTALWTGQGYALGTLNRMGPGYLPMALSVILGIIGLVLIAGSQFKPSELPEVRLVPLAAVLGSLVIFAVLLRPAGLFPAAFVCVVLASLVDDSISWKGRLGLGLGVAAFSSLVFIMALGMSVPLWWGR